MPLGLYIFFLPKPNLGICRQSSLLTYFSDRCPDRARRRPCWHVALDSRFVPQTQRDGEHAFHGDLLHFCMGSTVRVLASPHRLPCLTAGQAAASGTLALFTYRFGLGMRGLHADIPSPARRTFRTVPVVNDHLKCPTPRHCPLAPSGVPSSRSTSDPVMVQNCIRPVTPSSFVDPRSTVQSSVCLYASTSACVAPASTRHRQSACSTSREQWALRRPGSWRARCANRTSVRSSSWALVR